MKLSEILFRWKAAEQEKHQREPGVIYVTDLLECPLKRQYEEMFPEVAKAGFFNPVTLVGDIIHKGIQAIFDGALDAKFEVDGEIVLNSAKIRGRADMLMEDRVVDFKFVRSTYRIPHLHHLLQVRLYMRMFNKPKGSLLYVATDRITEIDETVEPCLAKPMTDEEIVMLLTQKNAPMWAEWECSVCQFSPCCSKARRGGE